MEYQEFEIEFSRVFDAAGSGLSTDELRAETERLRTLVDRMPEGDRERAGWDIAMLDDLLEHEDGPPPSAEMIEALKAYSAAVSDEGTLAQRITRAEKGIEEIDRIADEADPEEQLSIGSLNESLHMLVGALKGSG